MWRLVTRLLQIILLIAAASTLFVVGAVFVSSVGVIGAPPGDEPPVPEARVEVRLTSQGGAAHVFAGQPLVVDVVLLNLQAGQARDRIGSDETGKGSGSEILLDGDGDAWERRLTLETTTRDGSVVLENLPWHDRLLDSGSLSDPRLGRAPVRATFVLDGSDLASLAPGAYVIQATLPADMVAPEHARVIPLEVSITPAPTSDPDRASVSLAVAKVAALRGEPEAAIEAALTALALDPLQDEALTIVAESWEEQGDLDRAIEWYGRYLNTIPDAEVNRRAKLAAYVDALRAQL